jgi:hypothetical protein
MSCLSQALSSSVCHTECLFQRAIWHASAPISLTAVHPDVMLLFFFTLCQHLKALKALETEDRRRAWCCTSIVDNGVTVQIVRDCSGKAEFMSLKSFGKRAYRLKAVRGLAVASWALPLPLFLTRASSRRNLYSVASTHRAAESHIGAVV